MIKAFLERLHKIVFRALYLRSTRSHRAWNAYRAAAYALKYRAAGRISCLFRGHRPIARISLPARDEVIVCGSCGGRISPA